MEVTIESGGPCRKVMHVHAGPEAVREDYERLVGIYARQTKLAGFRKGKAPPAVVERQYRDKLAEHAKEELVPRLYRDALKQEEVVPVAIVGVGEVRFSREAGIDFNVTLDVAPDFKLPRYKKIVLRRKKIEVAEKDVDDAVMRIRESRARYEDVEGREVRMQDLVRIDYRGTCEGKSFAQVAPDNAALGECVDFLVLVGGKEIIPSLSEGLVGGTIGEKRDIKATFPADYRVAALAGKDALFEVEIKGIRERVLPPLDEALFKELKVDGEDALRDRVREELRHAAEREEEERLRNEVSRYLLDKTDFDLPQAVVEQETGLAVRNIVRSFVSRGATQEQIAQHQDRILSSAQETSRERVKLAYILSRIADEEGIAVDDDAVNARVAELAGHYRMPVEQFRGELEKRNGIVNLRSDIRNERTVDFLMENAKIKK